MNLFTKAIAATAILLSANAASAQSYLFDNPDNKAQLGARVALDFNSAADGGAMYSNQPGFSIGAVYQIPLWMNLYFEPGLSIFYDTFGTTRVNSIPQFNADGSAMTDEDGEPVSLDYRIDGSMRNFGFRVPLNVGFHFDVTDEIKVGVFTGPQINLSLVARYHQQEIKVPGEEEPAWGTSLFGTKGFRHIDLQWNFGVNVCYQHYYMAMSGSVGMSDMKIGTDELLTRDIRRNQFCITLGYNF